MKQVQHYEKQIVQEQSSYLSSNSTSNQANALNQKQKSLQLQLKARKQKKAMDIALSPGKQMMMNVFMMYMSGKNLNMFTISTLGMAIMNPIKGIVSVSSTFAPFEDDSNGENKSDYLQMPKLIFVALNFVWLGLGLYKMGSMRLLPTTTADWSGSVVWKELLEITSIPSI